MINYSTHCHCGLLEATVAVGMGTLLSAQSFPYFQHTESDAPDQGHANGALRPDHAVSAEEPKRIKESLISKDAVLVSKSDGIKAEKEITRYQ